MTRATAQLSLVLLVALIGGSLACSDTTMTTGGSDEDDADSDGGTDPPDTCGIDTCDGGKTNNSCEDDCWFGNGSCDNDEDETSCPEDCA